MVYERASGLTAADRAKAAADARAIAGVHGVLPGQVVGPVPSADGRAIQIIFQVDLGRQGWGNATKAVDSVRAITTSNANGLVSHITGPLGNAADSNNVFKGIDGTLLYSALAVVILILLITYRSPVLWLLPVISSGVALITAQAVIYLLAAHAGLTVNAQSAGILDVLVFGASTDYALLLVARYREELRRHDRRHAAMVEALRRAGPAIIASGCAVILALLTLFAAELNSTKDLGPVLAIGVAVGMVAMLTLLPALLVICPRGVFWPYRPSYGSVEPTTRGLWARVGWSIASRARLTWIVTAVILGVLALGLTGLKANGLTTAQGFRGRYQLPAVRVRVPGRAGHRLQHLPDDPGARGGDQARRPARRDRRHGRDRRGDHLAGFVLAGTFAVLATIPATFLTELGFAVAFGILLDTIVVRLLLVTALNLDVGRWMWWPSKLAQKPDPAPDELSRERADGHGDELTRPGQEGTLRRPGGRRASRLRYSAYGMARTSR